MDKSEFRGTRLKSARLFRGMTLTGLSSATGISKQSISLYENDKNKPEFDNIQKISNALMFPTEFFLQKDSCKTSTEVTYFRSLASATKMDRTSQSIKLEYVAKIYEILSNYIDFPSLNLPTVDFTDSFSDSFEENNELLCNEIERISSTLRNYWDIGDGPIGNLQFILEKNGFIVTGFDTNENAIDAFSQHTVLNNGDVFFISVDQGKKPEGRIRFDLSHELGHILLHPWSESLDLIDKDEFKLREKQANMFASSFLLPKSSFGKEVQAYPTSLQYYEMLKKKWKVSIQAMIYRSYQLNIISNNQFQYLMRQVSKKGWRQKEPGDKPYFLNANIFQGAIDLLIEEKILSPEGLMRLFRKYGITMYSKDIECLLSLKRGTLSSQDNLPQIIQLKSFIDK